jgi:hypothetical protein
MGRIDTRMRRDEGREKKKKIPDPSLPLPVHIYHITLFFAPSREWVANIVPL